MKKSERNKKDREFSAEVRSIGYCEKCGATEKLHCHHSVVNRSSNKLRWDKRNAICLCASCHAFAHLSPALFTEWLIDHIGQEKYNEVKAIANDVTKYIWEVKL